MKATSRPRPVVKPTESAGMACADNASARTSDARSRSEDIAVTGLQESDSRRRRTSLKTPAASSRHRLVRMQEARDRYGVQPDGTERSHRGLRAYHSKPQLPRLTADALAVGRSSVLRSTRLPPNLATAHAGLLLGSASRIIVYTIFHLSAKQPRYFRRSEAHCLLGAMYRPAGRSCSQICFAALATQISPRFIWSAM